MVSLNVQYRFTDVKLQDLALHFDRSDQNPDLIGIKFLRITSSETLQFFGHSRMLIRCSLKTKIHFLPGRG